MQRRSFFSRLAGVGGLGALFGAAPAAVGATGRAAAAASTFEAARHEQDAWFDSLPGSHRVIFDTWTHEKFAEGIQFAGNFFRANKDAYNLTDTDLAVIVGVRHNTQPFAFNDAMWAKYGKHFSARMVFTDPQTKQPPTTNLYGARLTALVKQGTQFSICNLTTRAYTKIISDATGTSQDDVYKELAANTLGPAHFVPAGVVGISRAQEHGYTVIAIG
jgi:intracellular sulfur oxidation DsrE/DsrF family protein